MLFILYAISPFSGAGDMGLLWLLPPRVCLDRYIHAMSRLSSAICLSNKGLTANTQNVRQKKRSPAYCQAVFSCSANLYTPLSHGGIYYVRKTKYVVHVIIQEYLAFACIVVDASY